MLAVDLELELSNSSSSGLFTPLVDVLAIAPVDLLQPCMKIHAEAACNHAVGRWLESRAGRSGIPAHAPRPSPSSPIFPCFLCAGAAVKEKLVQCAGGLGEIAASST